MGVKRVVDADIVLNCAEETLAELNSAVETEIFGYNKVCRAVVQVNIPASVAAETAACYDVCAENVEARVFSGFGVVKVGNVPVAVATP